MDNLPTATLSLDLAWIGEGPKEVDAHPPQLHHLWTTAEAVARLMMSRPPDRWSRSITIDSLWTVSGSATTRRAE